MFFFKSSCYEQSTFRVLWIAFNYFNIEYSFNISLSIFLVSVLIIKTIENISWHELTLKVVKNERVDHQESSGSEVLIMKWYGLVWTNMNWYEKIVKSVEIGKNEELLFMAFILHNEPQGTTRNIALKACRMKEFQWELWNF